MAQGEKTVWLLGAGASRPLGGPLFTDLISVRQSRWVNAWVGTRGGLSLQARDYTLDDCVKIYLQGRERDLWSNAEECIALLDRAQNDTMVAIVVQSAIVHQVDLRKDLILTVDKLPLRLDEVFAIHSVSSDRYEPLCSRRRRAAGGVASL